MVPKTPIDPSAQFGARPIHALLRESEALLPFHQRLRRLSRLQKIFVDALPPGLSDSCRIATVEGSTIIVATANGAVAAKLKQILPRLLLKISENKTQYQEVTAFSVIVQPEFFVPETPPPQHPPRPPLPLDKLAELAESLGDSPLKATLDSIAKSRQRALTNKRKNG